MLATSSVQFVGLFFLSLKYRKVRPVERHVKYVISYLFKVGGSGPP